MARICNSTAEEHVISIHAALHKSARITIHDNWTKVERSLDTCHWSFVVKLHSLEHFMISDDYSICIELIVLINLILKSLIRISNKSYSIQKKKYYDSICSETGCVRGEKSVRV